MYIYSDNLINDRSQRQRQTYGKDGKDISKGGHRSTGRTSRKVVIALREGHLERWSSLSCVALRLNFAPVEVYKKLVWERGWGGGGKV
jgi:hypothetical protein